jgi:hypothetical protein
MPSALTVFRLMAGPMRSGLMSQLGQTRKSARLNGMSVLPSTADVVGPPRHVRVVPVSDSCTAANSNAIRSSRQRAAEVAGAREAERLGGLEWDSLVGKAARSRENVMLPVSILRRRQYAAAVDTPSDGVHAG